MMRTRIIILALFLTLNHWVIAQKVDTLRNINLELITDQLENIAQSSDISFDYNDLVDDYLNLIANPININSKNISTLRNLYLINDNQYNNLLKYIKTFGPLFSIYELTSISGFTDETIINLKPYITVKPNEYNKPDKPADIAKYGRHQLILRYDQILEARNGYQLPPDSAIAHPGSVYLGNPQHYYLRYSFNYKNKYRAGVTMDKDAGEVLFKGHLSDSIKKLVGNKINNGYDFLSAYAYMENLGNVKKVVIGDYHLEFGQGLTLWSGLSFGKSAEATNLSRYGKGIRPNTSANENRFLRGGAASFGLKNILFTIWYSNNNIDGNLSELAYNNQEDITSIIETGMHRTINELYDKKTLNVQLIGGNIHYSGGWFQAGATAFKTKLDKPITLSDEMYKLFRFSGDNLLNYGCDVTATFQKISIFSEISASSNGGIAHITGINTYLNDRFTMSVVHHNYNKDYHNLYNNPFSETSAISNERGIYIGFKSLVSRKVSLSGYVDYFKFPWLKYHVDSPSHGSDILCQANITPSINYFGYFRFRYKNTQENFSDVNRYMTEIENINRHEFRFFISYKVTDFITFKDRADVILFSNKLVNENGYLMYHDALLRSPNIPVDATLRFALFSTDSYNSRIYTYENDVLYAFSVPSYFNNGMRWYLMIKYKLSKNITIWVRYSATKYFNKNTIGSGNDIIEGNRKSEFKAQTIIKL